jgi:hypothetical protein
MRHVRIAVMTALLLAFVGALVWLGRATASDPLALTGLLAALLGAPIAIVCIGSFYEWLVHRFVYHGPLFRPIYEIHQRGHHWHRFPPDRYVEAGPVERIPVYPPDPFTLCRSQPGRALAWAGQYALYMLVGVPLAFVPAWALTRNPLFTACAVVSGIAVCYYFIRVHDVIHYPADRWMERQAFFRFLDRHHYIHHVDTKVNVNFLLPLCDWLFGTLKVSLTEAEQTRWPRFEDAKRLPPVARARVPVAEGALAAAR